MLQSIRLYKVSDPGGLPLDRNGVPVNVSGERQAIALLEGTLNPNEALYDVVGYFSLASMFRGVNTFRLDPSCGGGILRVEPSRVDVSEGPKTVMLVSGSEWTSAPTSFAVLTPSAGPEGGHRIEVSPGDQFGQGWVTFTNSSGRKARVYVVNLPGALWILEDGTWNYDGKWTLDGLWNF